MTNKHEGRRSAADYIKGTLLPNQRENNLHEGLPMSIYWCPFVVNDVVAARQNDSPFPMTFSRWPSRLPSPGTSCPRPTNSACAEFCRRCGGRGGGEAAGAAELRSVGNVSWIGPRR